jgi:Protein of unknown function (DUF2636).
MTMLDIIQIIFICIIVITGLGLLVKVIKDEKYTNKYK